MPDPFEVERRAMVEEQLRRRGIRDERVLEAMLRVPRHEFVPAPFRFMAYEDRPVPIGLSETISQPYMVAVMTEAAAVKPGDKVLEVGTGAGYQAAVLATLGAQVWSIERNPRLAARAREVLSALGYDSVQVVEGDGTEGYPPAAPYQAIVVTAAAPSVPQPLLDQLADGGRLVIPVGDLQRQDLEVLTKHGVDTTVEVLDPCQFVPLIGRYGWTEEDRVRGYRNG
jgi:protein-L-isoaspartate(D-aspartate) O-methyltransferase